MTAVFLGAPPARHVPMLAELDRWVAQGWLRALDRSLAAFFSQQAPAADPLLILATALASHQLGRGHACLDLPAALADAGEALSLPPEHAPRSVEGPAPTPPAALLAGVDLARWKNALKNPSLVGHGPGATPLVLAGSRLYLRRYWQYEQSVREAIAQRVQCPTAAAGSAAQAPLEETTGRSRASSSPSGSLARSGSSGGALKRALDALFPHTDGAATDWQKVACALAARQGFSIITGGPGTGKTTTVVKLLAVLQHLALSGGEGAAGAAGGPPSAGGVLAGSFAEPGQPLRIRLAAPTGKAAARLNESIAGAVAQLPLQGLPDAEAVRAAIPTEVTTVHRLLGSRPDTRHFRHDARNPLALDVLVLDEASMLDLEMTAAVFAALPPHASLVLLGDKDQLASVEAGAVLGELCQRADAGHYTAQTAEWLQAVTGELLDPAYCDAAGRPLDQAVVKLRVSHRFSAESGVGQLAEAVNAGDPLAVRRVLGHGYADLSELRLAGEHDAALTRLVVDGAPEAFPGSAASASPPVGYRHYLGVMRERQPAADAPQPAFDAWAREVLAAYGQFQVLCALRSGPQGVAGLNQRIAGLLRAEGLLDAEHGGWYLGRPVLVTRNDYGLGLMNGDVGVTLALPERASGSGAAAGRTRWILRVAFAAGDGQGGIRWVLPSRLRAVETVFAMTVHKSQGSEFAHAALVLPERRSAVLTRELVYTGITRGKRWVTVVASGRGAGVGEVGLGRVVRTGGLMG